VNLLAETSGSPGVSQCETTHTWYSEVLMQIHAFHHPGCVFGSYSRLFSEARFTQWRRGNQATGAIAAVSGSVWNTASGDQASVSGSLNNTEAGPARVIGGQYIYRSGTAKTGAGFLGVCYLAISTGWG
jgi:hypothetical protein